jgi:predicted enzyme related to lactoylglutathione lyase
MTDFNSRNNRAVWFDIPVTDLDRAANFYRAVLGVLVHKEKMEGGAFGVIDHQDGNGGCLVPVKEAIAQGGVLIYLNANGRIRSAVAEVGKHGGKVLEGVHSIGPHGYRAIVLDSEGNRIALHSNIDG